MLGFISKSLVGATEPPVARYLVGGGTWAHVYMPFRQSHLLSPWKNREASWSIFITLSNMSTEYITLRVNNARGADDVPIILRDVATRTNMPNRRALRVRVGIKSVTLYGVKIPNNYCQMSELTLKLDSSGGVNEPLVARLDVDLNVTSPHFQTVGAHSKYSNSDLEHQEKPHPSPQGPVSQTTDILAKLAELFPVPLSTQQSVERIGEHMFTYKDGMDLADRLDNSDKTTQQELAALTEALPVFEPPVETSSASSVDWSAYYPQDPDWLMNSAASASPSSSSATALSNATKPDIELVCNTTNSGNKRARLE